MFFFVSCTQTFVLSSALYFSRSEADIAVHKNEDDAVIKHFPLEMVLLYHLKLILEKKFILSPNILLMVYWSWENRI